VVEDNESMREGMVQVLRKEGHEVLEAASGTAALGCLERARADVVITDYRMEEMDGLQLLKRVRQGDDPPEIIVITAHGTVELAVEAMKSGAWDFIQKPFSREELKLKVERVAQIIGERRDLGRLTEENLYLKEQVDTRFNFGEIVGDTEAMRQVFQTIRKAAPNDTSVIIYGESGTGKELVARAIHQHSPRREQPFIRVNCGALAEGVLESELFGHEKGAFTNAYRRKKGRFELADKGTLFLDEIGEVPPATQVKLLRVLQEREFERVGGEETLTVDVRVLAATTKDLSREIQEGRFRDDLYYRLHILPIVVPPLRDRREDISLLAAHFLGRLADELKKPDVRLTRAALERLMAYRWPGNVRELENVLERAVVLAEGPEIDADDLAFMLAEARGRAGIEDSLSLDEALAAFERRKLREAMQAAGGVKAKAARILGIKETTLYYKLDKHQLTDKETP